MHEGVAHVFFYLQAHQSGIWHIKLTKLKYIHGILWWHNIKKHTILGANL